MTGLTICEISGAGRVTAFPSLGTNDDVSFTLVAALHTDGVPALSIPFTQGPCRAGWTTSWEIRTGDTC